MKKILLLLIIAICLLSIICGKRVIKDTGSRFNRMDETSPEYTAKALDYMAAFYKSRDIPVDSIRVEGRILRIKIDSVLSDSLYRACAAASAVEYYKFKYKTALIRNQTVHVYCASRRGLVAQANYP